MKLRNIITIGRLRNKATGQEVNVRRGSRVGRGDDWYFYTYRGKRIYLPANEIHTVWEKVREIR